MYIISLLKISALKLVGRGGVLGQNPDSRSKNSENQEMCDLDPNWADLALLGGRFGIHLVPNLPL